MAQTLATLAQTQVLLVTLFYALTCQDLPPALEDTHMEFFGPGTGWFLRFLAWDPPELAVDPDESNPSLPSQLKTAVLEVAELYANLFSETLSENGVIQNFVQAVWELLGSGKRSAVSDDQLVSQALRMLATLVRQGSFANLFQSDEVIKSLVESVAVPNVALRDHETEQFEDDPDAVCMGSTSGSLAGPDEDDGPPTVAGANRYTVVDYCTKEILSDSFVPRG